MKLTILSLLLVISVYSYAQEYQVLHVKGKIVKEKDGSLLKPGDKILEEDKIKFESKDAMAAVLNKEKGRYILRLDQEEEEGNDLVYVLKSTISPVRGGMSTRAAGINNDVDFQLYFGGDPYVWAGETLKIPVSSVTYPMNNHLFFFLEYEVEGETISKKLDHEKDFLVLKKKHVFSVDGQQVDPAGIVGYNLYYYNEKEESARLITPIDFVLIDDEELQAIYVTYGEITEDTNYEIAEVLSSLYGKCDPMQLQYNDPE